MNRFLSTIAGFGLIVGASALGAFLGLCVALISFAIWTGIVAVVFWGVWNFVAPMLDFIPEHYRHLAFLQMWGIVAVLRLFSRFLKSK